VDEIKNVDLAETYHPDFTHQIFGEDEKMYGYKKPVLKLYYSASCMNIYLDMDYESVLERGKKKSAKFQDVVAILSNYFDKGQRILMC
jgi:histone acetyltransferase 1